MPRGLSEAVDEIRGSGLGSFFTNKVLALAGFFVLLFVLALSAHLMVETNDAGWISIRQAAGTGTLTAYTQPGMFPRMFGDVERYKQADVLYFSKHDNEGANKDDSIEVRFNDGATANVTGNIRIELPLDPDKLKNIHTKFRSYDSLIKDTVRQVVSESAILTAALMTAEESYTTKRAEFSQLADDQVRNGVYLTEAEAISVKDPKSGETLVKQVVRIARDTEGKPLRKESVLSQYGIRVTQFVVKEIDYQDTVAKQIDQKQQAIMQVVSAKAQAEKAVQDRLTAEEVGRKNVAVAKYEQEVKRATAVTMAEQELDVAKLHKSAEEQNKLALILKGEGEGEYRRKLMVADGALDKKLATYEKVNQFWADALAHSANPLVLGIVFGQTGAQTGNAAQTMMELMSLKAAKDLSLDIRANAASKSTTAAGKSDE